MTAEAELLLMNASRAQLVREVIRPALAAGEIVFCDRFYDSSTAYQGYGRQLDLKMVQAVIDFAVGETRPDLTLLLTSRTEISEQRLRDAPSHPALHPRPASRRRTRNFSSAWPRVSPPSPPPSQSACGCGRSAGRKSSAPKNLGAGRAGFAESRALVNFVCRIQKRKVILLSGP